MKLMELYRDKIMGAISGLDRIRFRGTLRWLASERGLSTFMNHARILLKEVVCGACNKVIKESKTYRGLNPWQQDDYRMLMFLSKGENAINGFRNHDLRKWLYRESEQTGKDQQKKYSGRTTRRIKLLRAHGLIRKIPRANRYVLTEKNKIYPLLRHKKYLVFFTLPQYSPISRVLR